MRESEIYEQLGQLVRRHRNRLSMSQETLSEKLGLSRASVANIEAGRQHIPLHHLYSLARALRVEPHTLLPSQEARSDSSARPRISSAIGLNDREEANVARVVGSIDLPTK